MIVELRGSDSLRHYIQWILASCPRKMVGYVNHHHAGVGVESQFETERRLVVQDALPPVRRHEFGQDHRDSGVRMIFANRVDVGNEWRDQ